MLENSRSYRAFLNSPLSCRKYSTYFPIYDSILSQYIGKKIIFVEIGVQDGGSLIFWQDFFGPNARIIGIDLNPKAKRFEKFGFEIFIGDQASVNFWANFINQVGNVDIVLDDGGHTYLQQIVTVESLATHINDGGLIMVEDAHTSMLSGFGNRKYSFLNYAKTISSLLTNRSGKLIKKNYDKRFYSIQFFESVVVFHISRELTKDKSFLIKNNNSSTGSEDFRYEQNFLWRLYFSLRAKIKFMSKNTIIKKMIKGFFIFLNDNLFSTWELKKIFKANRGIMKL
jgi:hypothetical protein